MLIFRSNKHTSVISPNSVEQVKLTCLDSPISRLHIAKFLKASAGPRQHFLKKKVDRIVYGFISTFMLKQRFTNSLRRIKRTHSPRMGISGSCGAFCLIFYLKKARENVYI